MRRIPASVLASFSCRSRLASSAGAKPLVSITKEHLFSRWVDDVLTPELLGPDRTFERTMANPSGGSQTKTWPLAAAAPVSRRARPPDPALSHRHASPPAAVNAGHFSPDADSRPKTGCRRLPAGPRWPASHPVTPGQAGNDPP